ncbi:MAG: hypothetical protein A2Z25_10535 [Planctomycetes bacterium RBG_16_55_9]|nr:MAG: hypothetical protein A2Z25_10535 [Planctomycetes bacterium RBG_16_55_9]
MAEHFLDQYVEGEKGFLAEPWYNALGDCIEYHTANEAVVADRIDEKLTIYRSVTTNKPVGFKLKDVQAILSRYGCAGLAVMSLEQNKTLISVAAILLAAYEDGPPSIKRRLAYANALLPPENPFSIPVDRICKSSLRQTV